MILRLGFFSLFAAGVSVAAGCGANVVFQSDGGGGSSSSSGASSAGGFAPQGGTSSQGGSTSLDCNDLLAQLTERLAAATACNPCIDFDPCPNGKVISDQCGRPVGTSDDVLAQQASEAYDAWVAAGCGPFKCDAPCVGGEGAVWFCTSTEPGCVGVCTPAFPG